ncbi:MAG: PHP domain-containing protein [Bacillota bacterium]|nr:PHP domain-containing protein [Bacillota bacterium]
MKFDLHLHSRHSPDSKSKVKDIIDKALRTELQGVSITDHNCFDGSEEALSINTSDLIIVPGAEYSTDQGHILVYFLKYGIEKLNLDTDSMGRYRWQDIIQEAHRQDALAFLAHPYRYKKNYESDIWQEVDGIEIYNSRAALCRNMNANLRAFEQASEMNKAFSAGSDGHWLGEIGNAFWEYENIKENKTDINEEIKQALRSGKGKVFGSATNRFYEPSSQIFKRLHARKYLNLPKPLIKMAYACVMETGRYLGIGEKPMEGWLDIDSNEKE